MVDSYLSNSESSDFEIAAASLVGRIWLPLSDMVGCSFVPPLRRRSAVTGPTAVGMRESAKESHRRIACRWPPGHPMIPASDCPLKINDVCGAWH